MSGVRDNLVHDLNEFLGKLVDDGCFDHASKLVDILEEHGLLDPDFGDTDYDVSEDED